MKNSLPPRTKRAAQHKLDAITHVIYEAVGDNLAMLILFGSYARGKQVNDRYVDKRGIFYTYESDFDLLVVTEDQDSATSMGTIRIEEMIELGLQRFKIDPLSISIIVEHIDNLNEALRRNKYFYVDIAKDGVLLFDNGRHTLVEPGPLEPAELQKDMREDFEQWFTSANDFLINSQNAFDRGSYKNAAFELHQATERFLNAAILTFTRYKPRTHDVAKLERRACNQHPDFSQVFPRESDQEKHCFKQLKKAYIDARYNPDYVITKEELDYLISRVHILQELTKRICEEKIATMA